MLQVQPVQDDIADVVVAESQRLMRPGLHHQKALVKGGCQHLRQNACWSGGGGLQQAQLGSPAQTRHLLHHLP